MAGSIPISQLNNDTTPNLSDILVVVDPTNTTMAPTGTTENLYFWQFVNFILGFQGLATYQAVSQASTVALTATYSNGILGVGATLTNAGTMGVLFLDGSAAPTLGQRVLIKNQAAPAQNGIYTVTTLGSAIVNWVLTRATDLDVANQFINNAIVGVLFGNANGGTIWQLSCPATFVVGTSADKWNPFLIPPPQLFWTDVTAVSVNAIVNNGYIADRSSTPVQIVLPANFNIGDTVIVMGKGTGGWSLVANSGQTIVFGGATTSTAGAISSDIQYGNIQVRGLVADTTWEVVSVLGNPSYI